MSEKEFQIYMARLYLKEARVRSKNPMQRGFCFVLIEWAGNCRRRAMSVAEVQPDLFA